MGRMLKRLAVVSTTAALGCASLYGGSAFAASSSPMSAEQALVATPPWYQKPTALQIKEAETLTNANFAKNIYSPAPNGSKAFPVPNIHISPSQLAKIKAGHYTLALAMHYLGADYSNQVVSGVQDEAKKLGIKVVAVTNANFKDSTQIADLEAISAKKPSITVALPVNPQTESLAFKSLAAKGVKLAFIDQPAANMTPGKDYVSVVNCDNYANAMAAADILAASMHDKGNITVIYYNDNFPVLNTRYEGFTTRMMYKYPNIHIVGLTAITGPNDGMSKASALLTKYPNTQGMWVPWSDPAEGAKSAALNAGKTPSNFTITTMDLDSLAATSIAQNGIIKGLGAQRPYDEGAAAVEEAALSLIGAKTHEYVTETALPVDHANLSKTYAQVFHKSLPSNLKSALGK